VAVASSRGGSPAAKVPTKVTRRVRLAILLFGLLVCRPHQNRKLPCSPMLHARGFSIAIGRSLDDGACPLSTVHRRRRPARTSAAENTSKRNQAFGTHLPLSAPGAHLTNHWEPACFLASSVNGQLRPQRCALCFCRSPDLHVRWRLKWRIRLRLRLRVQGVFQ
jgi:hypothetical protein